MIVILNNIWKICTLFNQLFPSHNQERDNPFGLILPLLKMLFCFAFLFNIDSLTTGFLASEKGNREQFSWRVSVSFEVLNPRLYSQRECGPERDPELKRSIHELRICPSVQSQSGPQFGDLSLTLDVSALISWEFICTRKCLIKV